MFPWFITGHGHKLTELSWKYKLIFLLRFDNSIELVLLFIRNELDVFADKKADDHEAGKKGMRKYCSKLVLV